MSGDIQIETAAAAGFREDALARFRDAILRDMANGLHHGATIVLARHGKVVLHEALGVADRDTRRPSRTSDRYWLASTSKAITAFAIMKAIDKGLLTLDTKVADVFPEFGIRGKKRVTIYHLLTHTAGTWPHFLPPPPLSWGRDVFDLQKMANAIAAQQLASRPGDLVVYNPFADFAILGEVLRRVEGRPFREVLRQEVFEPLGLNTMTCGLAVGHPDRVPVRLADLNPGAASTEVMHSFDDVDEQAEIPGGGIFSTAADVFRFAEMLRLGGTDGKTRVLSAAATSYALKNHTGGKPNVFWDFSKEDRDVAEFPANFCLMGGYVRGEGHHMSPLGNFASPDSFGAVGSGSTMFMVDPSRGLTFVILTAGLMEGLGHFQRLERLSDLAVAALDD
ncbi:serine hydrolase [Sphingobium sp. DC-2]|uniref:serine hydrolase domain-containing protein n=1 Tax=Sphingobium sp. DC-2 TaxID=1303256 RepID=UPI0004C320CE|nr:serine hydrolase domain-containing protein [Sphingobium sp. DC-2]